MDKTYEYMIKLSRLINKLELKIETIAKELDKNKIDSKETLVKELNELSKKIPDIKQLEKSISDMKPKHNDEDKFMFMLKVIDRMKQYTIEKGIWHFEGKSLGIIAEAKDGKDGKDGLNGKDGTNGKDGKNGRDGTNGRDGIDGKNGIDGINGIDGLTPIFEEVETETIGSAEQAEVNVERRGNSYKLKLKIPRGASGHNGPRGIDGKTITTETMTLEYWLEHKDELDPNTIYHESLVF